MLISNSAQFMAEMNVKLAQLVENVMQRLLIELGNIIDENIYNYPSKGSWHGRTGEFKDSWDYSVPTYEFGMITSILSNSNFKFTWDNHRDTLSHGNFWNPLTTQAMDEILNDSCGGGMNFPIRNTYYWDKFESFLNVNFENIVMQESQKLGFPLEQGQIGYIFK